MQSREQRLRRQGLFLVPPEREREREREREMKWQERPDLDEMGSSQD